LSYFVTSLFFWWGAVIPMPNLQAGGPSFVDCPWLLIQFIHTYSPYLEAISSIHNLKMCHVMVKEIPSNMDHIPTAMTIVACQNPVLVMVVTPPHSSLNKTHVAKLLSFCHFPTGMPDGHCHSNFLWRVSLPHLPTSPFTNIRNLFIFVFILIHW
jgi:hypothetical protein